MKVIHDFRGIGKKNCGIRHSAIFYLKALRDQEDWYSIIEYADEMLFYDNSNISIFDINFF